MQIESREGAAVRKKLGNVNLNLTTCPRETISANRVVGQVERDKAALAPGASLEMVAQP